MLRPVLAAALLLMTPALVVAQSDVEALAKQQDPQAAYTKLARDFAKAMAKHQSELKQKIAQAKQAGERVPRSAYRQPTKEFVETHQ